MTSYPLTPDGVSAKLAELYALSDPALSAEAQSIRTDFKSWIKSNFNLSTIQLNCLHSIDKDVCDYWGSNCSICFLYRKDIGFTDPGTPGPGYGKWSEGSGNLSVVDGPTGPVVTGEFAFEMLYKVL